MNTTPLRDYERTVHFADTDAAGVVYFANLLRFCHEAYEDVLAQLGVDLRQFFSNNGLIVPITEAQVRFLKPLYCGDRLRVTIDPQRLDHSRFQLTYTLYNAGGDRVAIAQTQHICLQERQRVAIPEPLSRWLKSALEETSDRED
ncbi:thioesterase family protein [Thermosynechococcus sp. JY1334]|uniref:acyl-CoA thioesterase n=1 Tax=unclassified Thermosynechococcus TaxID=2622553 RepID=UPI002671ECF3|nr:MULTISPECIES: thioesterase family protein [unclassified Thermosynechococcus]MDR7897934.1 thioesterase family protein [Thermosynechococcus sp. JY1332]MDR7905333.1 thioesterase family protein [Thermosynechococcus sp. JY1334]MDR7993158.1 thioesterase family protein [Thermosynechococcus sp. TG252]WKT87545.1 thioesterase family protein [Thermosynechococcus sp. JY1339]WNC56484.1 thioesterase family protein [Thermosynechococcus sp. JY1331]